MDKKQLAKGIKITIIIVAIAIFINCCMTTNIPDQFEIIHTIEPIQAFHNKTGWTYQYLKREIIPGQLMRLLWGYHHYGHYLNTNTLDVYGELHINRPYKKIYIKEISYLYNRKKYILIREETFYINNYKEDDILVNINDEPILIDGEKYYYTYVDFKKKVKTHFLRGFFGQEKEIEFTQIYSLDNDPLREEKYKCKVILGGKKFDPMRLIIWMFPP